MKTSKHRDSSFYSSVSSNRGKVKCCVVAVNYHSDCLGRAEMTEAMVAALIFENDGIAVFCTASRIAVLCARDCVLAQQETQSLTETPTLPKTF